MLNPIIMPGNQQLTNSSVGQPLIVTWDQRRGWRVQPARLLCTQY